MASRAPSNSIENRASFRTLLTLGMFVFGMDSLAYSEFQRKISWRHGKTERHGARPASQFLGPGEDTITLEGAFIPGVFGNHSDIKRLIEMADSGEAWPLILAATGEVLGIFEITNVDQRFKSIMAGGLPRWVDFGIDLNRVD